MRQLEAKTMRPFIQNAVSSFKRGLEECHFQEVSSARENIVPGYSYLSTIDQREPLPEGCDRRRAGIFYADIADYSRLTEQDEEGTHHRLVESMKIMEAHVAANNGRVAHFAGDAILAEFRDANSALNCAINVQLSARRLNAHLHANQQVLFRIGVNFGDVIVDHGDIFGNAGNLTARLEKLAHTGGVCVSESIMSNLKNHPTFKFVAMGKQYLKNISEPVHAFWIQFDAEQVENFDSSREKSVSAAAS